MSRWLTDELHISLSHAQVGLLRVGRSLGLKGIRRQWVAGENLTCRQEGNPIVWENSLQAMDTLLAKHAAGKPEVTLVLSNQFVRYVLLPWSDLISGDEQLQAFARHCFQMIYGDASAGWALRLSRAKVGTAQLACAIDEKLLAACHAAVVRHGLRVVSVQPYLMHVFNCLKGEMKEADGWFALLEPGNICLAQFSQGSWVRFRSARLADGWEEFARFVAREAFLNADEAQSATQTLYVYAPHLEISQEIGGWNIQPLQAAVAVDMDGGGGNLLLSLGDAAYG